MAEALLNLMVLIMQVEQVALLMSINQWLKPLVVFLMPELVEEQFQLMVAQEKLESIRMATTAMD